MSMFVLFVKTGYENKVMMEVSCTWLFDKTLYPFSPTYDTYYKRGGKFVIVKKLWLPGYVFIESKLSGLDFYALSKPFINYSQYIFKLLRYGGSHLDTSFEMTSDECQFIKHLTGAERCVGISVGVIDKSILNIISGPLIGLESFVKKIDRHKRLAYVEINIHGEPRVVKFGLEVIRKN